MKTFDLESPPPGFAQEAHDGWLEDVTVHPSAGEVWMLSWDGAVVGLALITSVLDDYIRAMPITVGTEFATAGEAILPGAYLGEDATIWFRAETGLGKFLLHRRLHSALNLDQIHQLRRAAYAGEAAPFEVGSTAAEISRSHLIETINAFAALCHLEWPSAGPDEGVLNVGLLTERSITAKDVARAAELSVPEALAVWRRDWAVSQPVARKLCRAFGIDEQDLLVAAIDGFTMELSEPRVKSRVLHLSQARCTSERDARNFTRRELSTSGRSDSITGRNYTLVEDTLDRLIAEANDASDAH